MPTVSCILGARRRRKKGDWKVVRPCQRVVAFGRTSYYDYYTHYTATTDVRACVQVRPGGASAPIRLERL